MSRKLGDPIAHSATKKTLENTKRKLRHSVTRKKQLTEMIGSVKKKTCADQHVIMALQDKHVHRQKSQEELHEQILRDQEGRRRASLAASEQVNVLKKRVRTLEKRVAREKATCDQLARKAKTTPTIFKMMHGKAYSVHARKLARSMVLAGCARAKVGSLLQNIGNVLGIKLDHQMSSRTVSRTMLEGYVGAKAQLGYEISQSKG